MGKGPRLPSLLISVASLGIPQTTLRFDDSPQGFTEFRNTIILVVTVYGGEQTQIKISQEKRHMGQHPGKFHAQGFCLFPLSAVADSGNSPGSDK